MRKFVVCSTENAYEFGPATQQVIVAEGVKEAAIALNTQIVEEKRALWQEEKDRYDAQQAGTPVPEPATQPGGRAKPKKKVGRVRNPGDFKEPKATGVVVLDVENDAWHRVSVSPPPPPPREEWDWQVKGFTDIEELDEDDDDL